MKTRIPLALVFHHCAPFGFMSIVANEPYGLHPVHGIIQHVIYYFYFSHHCVVIAFKSTSADTVIYCIFTSGGRQRIGAGHPQYFQRAAGLFDILADIRHNGRTTFRRKILQGETVVRSSSC